VEAFEQFVAVAMQAETPGLVVSGAVKFPVTRQTRKAAYEEIQTHGYEVDLVGANSKQLVLATVKSFFGSRGVRATNVIGTGRAAGGYRLLNDPVIRNGVIAEASERYGYPQKKIVLRFYVGKFAPGDEQPIREWCAAQELTSGPIQVYGVQDVVARVMETASKRTYVDDASVVAVKVLAAAGQITLPKSAPRSRRETPG
jgi:hypothetical protein